MTFPKGCRLLKNREFGRISREGRRLVGFFLCVERAKTSKGLRLGITASARYGNAPERNRFKRLVREAFRLGRPILPVHFEVNVIPRKPAKTATLAEIKKELYELILA